jgi:hypothetical protein
LASFAADVVAIASMTRPTIWERIGLTAQAIRYPQNAAAGAPEAVVHRARRPAARSATIAA